MRGTQRDEVGRIERTVRAAGYWQDVVHGYIPMIEAYPDRVHVTNAKLTEMIVSVPGALARMLPSLLAPEAPCLSVVPIMIFEPLLLSLSSCLADHLDVMYSPTLWTTF